VKDEGDAPFRSGIGFPAAAGLALALASAPVSSARADPEPSEAFHAGMSVGIGSSYALVGGRIELGSDHLGGFLGYGLLGPLTGVLSGPRIICGGARWYEGAHPGVFVSLNLGYSWLYPGSLFTGTAVVGYRSRTESGLVLEAGVGGGIYRYRNPRDTHPSLQPSGLFPDVSLGIGFEL
jgi:hypothetical protein